MKPAEFFQKAPHCCCIKYGAVTVDVTYIGREAMFAHGRERGTGRRLFLILNDGRLKDGERFYNELEIIQQ